MRNESGPRVLFPWQLPDTDILPKASEILGVYFGKRWKDWKVSSFHQPAVPRVISFEKSLQKAPYQLFYIPEKECSFFAIVYSILCKKAFIMIPKELVDTSLVDTVLEKVVFHPPFKDADSLVHALYFLIHFGSKDHSVVERNKSFFIKNKDLEKAIWLSWNSRTNAVPQNLAQLQNREILQVNRNKVTRLLSNDDNVELQEPHEDTVETTWKGIVVLFTSNSDTKVVVYDATSDEIISDPGKVTAFLHLFYPGPMGNVIFPPFGLSRETLWDRVLYYQDSFGELPIVKVTFPNKVSSLKDMFPQERFRDGNIRKYLEGQRDIIEDVPVTDETPRPEAVFQALSCEKVKEVLPEDDTDFFLEFRYVSIYIAFYKHFLFVKILYFLFLHKGDIESTVKAIGEQREMQNDTRLGIAIFLEQMGLPLQIEKVDWVETTLKELFIEKNPEKYNGVLGKTILSENETYILLEFDKESQKRSSGCILRLENSQKLFFTEIQNLYEIDAEDGEDLIGYAKEQWLGVLGPSEQVYYWDRTGEKKPAVIVEIHELTFSQFRAQNIRTKKWVHFNFHGVDLQSIKMAAQFQVK